VPDGRGSVVRSCNAWASTGTVAGNVDGIVLLSRLFSEMAASVGSTLMLLGLFSVLVAAAGWR